MDDVGIGQHGYCFITDSNGEIIYHPQQQLLYSGLKTEATEGLDLSHNGSFETEELICSVLALDNCNWKVVGVSYISELVTAKEMELVGETSVVMLTIILLTTMVVSVLVSRLVTNPVQRLIRLWKSSEKDAAGYVYQPVEGTTETRHCHSPIRAHGKKDPETDEAGTSGMRKNGVKGSAGPDQSPLIYQYVGCHRVALRGRKVSDAVEMVNALAKLFRISISKGHELIPIEKRSRACQKLFKDPEFPL